MASNGKMKSIAGAGTDTVEPYSPKSPVNKKEANANRTLPIGKVSVHCNGQIVMASSNAWLSATLIFILVLTALFAYLAMGLIVQQLGHGLPPLTYYYFCWPCPWP